MHIHVESGLHTEPSLELLWLKYYGTVIILIRHPLDTHSFCSSSWSFINIFSSTFVFIFKHVIWLNLYKKQICELLEQELVSFMFPIYNICFNCCLFLVFKSTKKSQLLKFEKVEHCVFSKLEHATLSNWFYLWAKSLHIEWKTIFFATEFFAIDAKK